MKRHNLTVCLVLLIGIIAVTMGAVALVMYLFDMSFETAAISCLIVGAISERFEKALPKWLKIFPHKEKG